MYTLVSDFVAYPVLALLELPPAEFKMFMDSIIWAIKHTMRDIADTGLNCAR